MMVTFLLDLGQSLEESVTWESSNSSLLPSFHYVLPLLTLNTLSLGIELSIRKKFAFLPHVAIVLFLQGKHLESLKLLI